jgi:hypothetical protein
MKPVHNWRRVLRIAWSVRLMILAVLLSGLEAALPYLDGFIPIPPGLFAVLTVFTGCAALLARLIAQKGLSDGE